MYANYFVVAAKPKYIESKSECKNISANPSLFLLIEIEIIRSSHQNFKSCRLNLEEISISLIQKEDFIHLNKPNIYLLEN